MVVDPRLEHGYLDFKILPELLGQDIKDRILFFRGVSNGHSVR